MLADIMVEKLMKPIIFRYLEETYPNENMEILDKNVHKEYKDILSRTSSIGGLLKNGSLQVTLVIGAYAIAIIHVLGEKIDEEKFKALIDYVDNSEEMKKMYGGKNAFSDKEIKGRIKQAKFSQENHNK